MLNFIVPLYFVLTHRHGGLNTTPFTLSTNFLHSYNVCPQWTSTLTSTTYSSFFHRIKTLTYWCLRLSCLLIWWKTKHSCRPTDALLILRTTMAHLRLHFTVPESKGGADLCFQIKGNTGTLCTPPSSRELQFLHFNLNALIIGSPSINCLQWSKTWL